MRRRRSDTATDSFTDMVVLSRREDLPDPSLDAYDAGLDLVQCGWRATDTDIDRGGEEGVACLTRATWSGNGKAK